MVFNLPEEAIAEGESKMNKGLKILAGIVAFAVLNIVFGAVIVSFLHW
ncbi:MAG: hypothetical protein NTV48_03100 [Candidatus Vogelbacteria bacterium]|nr:hypothetical protein [Candidatus Vogelbacteria bacterium]